MTAPPSAADDPSPPETTFERDRGVTHLSARSGVARFTVWVPSPPADMPAVFEALASAGINVYLIKVQEEYLGFSVSSEDTERAIAVLQHSHMRYGLSRDCALVSVVSPAMRDLSGVLWRIIGCLRDSEVEILELADAYNAVSCLIAEADRDRAVAALSETFGVGLGTDRLDPW